MIALCYVLAGSILALIGLLATQAIWLHSANSQTNTLRDTIDGKDTAISALTEERNGLVVKAATAQDAATKAIDRLAIAESERNQAQRQVAAQVAEEIRHAPTTQSALDVLNRIMSTALPGNDPAAASHGDPAPTAVHAADAAAAVPGSGHP